MVRGLLAACQADSCNLKARQIHVIRADEILMIVIIMMVAVGRDFRAAGALPAAVLVIFASVGYCAYDYWLILCDSFSVGEKYLFAS